MWDSFELAVFDRDCSANQQQLLERTINQSHAEEDVNLFIDEDRNRSQISNIQLLM
jgi:hypothetical protein